MKYFVNIHTAEELRKAYRALCLTMHPDKGGNEEEFKAMQAEFETLKKAYQNGTAGRTAYTYTQHQETAEERARREEEERREREEWERWEAEEKARREQEEREKAERIRKAQEEARQAVREWAGRLERVAEDKTGGRARYYRFSDKKAAAAFMATTKRNIKAVINHYFPGLDVKVTISGEIWKEKFIISWQDGPSVRELRDKCKELAYFLPAAYHCAGMGEDYGHYEQDHRTAPWREAYGQALGDIDEYTTARDLSEEGREQVESKCADIFKNWNTQSDKGEGLVKISISEWQKFREACGIDPKEWNAEGLYWNNYINYEDTNNGEGTTGHAYKSALRRAARENFGVSVDKEAQQAKKAAQFVPRYGDTLKTLFQLVGMSRKADENENRVFWKREGVRRHWTSHTVTIAEAVELMEKGEAVYYGIEHRQEDKPGNVWHWGTSQGGYKVQQKRAEKFAAAGYILGAAGRNDPHGFVYINGIAPETAAAIRAELADIERQREQWEREQAEPKAAQTTKRPNDQTTSTQTTKRPNDQTTKQAEGVDLTAAPAEGLRLIETAEGVAVVADDWKTTYFNKKYIKAHGAHWNKERKQWEATDPEDVARLRAWFALRNEEQTNAPAPIYSECEKMENPAEPEPLAIAASRDTDEEPAPANYSASEKSETPAAVFTSTATDEERAKAPAAWMERAPILEKIIFRIAAPWKTWLCPYFGARDVWASYCKEAYKDNAAKLEEWAVTAHLGDTATFDGLTLTVWERDRHSLGGPDGFAPIYDNEAAKEENDNWNNGRRVLVPVMFDYEGRRRFVFNFTEKFTERRGGGFYDCELNDSRRKVADYFHQLNENGGKYFAFYCADWGKYGSKHPKKDLFAFLEWIKDGGYTFVRDMTDFTVMDDFTDFSGNLNEYSAAFWFRIYDKELAARLIDELSHIRIYNEDGNITRPDTDPAPHYSGCGTSEPTDAEKSASWLTNYTADDFHKLTTQSEVHKEDRDIIGKRFRFVSKYGDFFEWQIFVQDYAGNEAHALYYVWDEFMQEVRAGVRSLSWLREKLTEANGWRETA